MNNIHNLSFSSWPFPGPKNNFNNCNLSLSKFGMLAYSSDNIISIFAEELDRYTPMLMWKPFGNSSTSKNSRITAIGWYDASCCFEVSLPVIVIASGAGNIIVFDIRSTKVIANFKRKNDYITTIKWSPFSTSTFFAGTSSGSLIRFEVDLSQVVTSIFKWEIQFSEMQIDFIAIDEIDGNRAAVASKSGNFGVVYNINTDNPFHSADSLLICEKGKKIMNCSFFPIHRNFLIVSTNSESLLYALEEGVSVPLLNIPDIQQIQISRNLGNRAIVVRTSTVELWELQKDMSKRISSTKISSSKLSNISDIQRVDILDDTVVILTSTFWLTTIELRRNKLFVSKRVKLFNSKPNYFAFANDAFAFCTEDGKVLVTRTSSPKFKMLMRWNRPKSAASAANQVKNDEETEKKQIDQSEKNEEKPNDSSKISKTEEKQKDSSETAKNEEKTNDSSEISKTEEKPNDSPDATKNEEKPNDSPETAKSEKNGDTQSEEKKEKEGEDAKANTQKIRRHMTLGVFKFKEDGDFNFLGEGSGKSSSNEEETNNEKAPNKNNNNKTANSSQSQLQKPAKAAPGRRRAKTARRYSISDISMNTRSSDSFKIQKTFDPLPEDDEIVAKSVIIRRGTAKNRPSFLDEANEEGSYKNVTTQFIDGKSSFEQPSNGLVLGTNSSLPVKTTTPQLGPSSLPLHQHLQPPSTAVSAAPKPPLPHAAKVPSFAGNVYNNEAVSKTGSSLKKQNEGSKEAEEKRVKIPMQISKLSERKRRRLSSSIEEVNIASNLVHFARKTRIASLKDSSFSFDPSISSRDTSSIPTPMSTPKASCVDSSKATKEAGKENEKKNQFLVNGAASDLPFKETVGNVKEQIRTVKTQNMYGNNCSFLWCYNVSNPEFNNEKASSAMNSVCKKLNHVEWITGTRLLAWNQDKDWLVNLLNENNSSQQTTDQPVKSIVSLKNIQGILYIIDLKVHRVVPLFKKPGMNITDVVVSKNKQLFAITVNGFIVSVFISSNKLGQRILGTITFQSEVVVAFVNDIAVMIGIRSRTMTVTLPIDIRKPSFENGGKRKLMIKPSYGIITCAIGSAKGIFIGTSSGTILKVEAVTYNVTEVFQMSSAIVKFQWTSPSSKDSSFLATNINGSALMMNDDGEYVPIKGKFSHAIPISPDVIAGTPISSGKNSNNNSAGTQGNENANENTNDSSKVEQYFIDAVSVSSGVYKPKFPTVAARNPLMKPRSKWATILKRDEPTVKDLPMYGIPLIAKLIDAERNPNYSMQQTLLLRDLIMNTPQLWHRAFRYSLLIKDNDAAKALLETMPSDHPDYMNCLMKRALFGCAKKKLYFLPGPNTASISNSGSNSSLSAVYMVNDENMEYPESVESVLAAAQLMDANGHVKDAVDILLIGGLWINACKMLVKKNLIHNAISIARICAEKNNFGEDQLYKPSGSLYVHKHVNENNLVIKELADILLSKNLMPSYAAIILCEAGFIDDVISILQDAGEPEQARILTVAE